MHTALPALKKANQIIPNFGAGAVIFPFLHVVMAYSFSVYHSPSNGTCIGAVKEMDAIISCFDLLDVEYTVATGITLIVNGELFPVSFSESFTPISPSLLSSTSGLLLKHCLHYIYIHYHCPKRTLNPLSASISNVH